VAQPSTTREKNCSRRLGGRIPNCGKTRANPQLPGLFAIVGFSDRAGIYAGSTGLLPGYST
jgi:hypothetical protein